MELDICIHVRIHANECDFRNWILREHIDDRGFFGMCSLVSRSRRWCHVSENQMERHPKFFQGAIHS